MRCSRLRERPGPGRSGEGIARAQRDRPMDRVIDGPSRMSRRNISVVSRRFTLRRRSFSVAGRPGRASRCDLFRIFGPSLSSKLIYSELARPGILIIAIYPGIYHIAAEASNRRVTWRAASALSRCRRRGHLHPYRHTVGVHGQVQFAVQPPLVRANFPSPAGPAGHLVVVLQRGDGLWRGIVRIWIFGVPGLSLVVLRIGSVP